MRNSISLERTYEGFQLFNLRCRRHGNRPAFVCRHPGTPWVMLNNRIEDADRQAGIRWMPVKPRGGRLDDNKIRIVWRSARASHWLGCTKAPCRGFGMVKIRRKRQSQPHQGRHPADAGYKSEIRLAARLCGAVSSCLPSSQHGLRFRRRLERLPQHGTEAIRSKTPLRALMRS